MAGKSWSPHAEDLRIEPSPTAPRHHHTVIQQVSMVSSYAPPSFLPPPPLFFHIFRLKLKKKKTEKQKRKNGYNFSWRNAMLQRCPPPIVCPAVIVFCPSTSSASRKYTLLTGLSNTKIHKPPMRQRITDQVPKPDQVFFRVRTFP